MATMRDVAERAAVSMATVSHVINGTRYVSPTLTTRVRSAMEALSYRPDAVARSLRRRETLTVGLLLPSTEIPFFASVARHIEHAAFSSGYSVILSNSDWRLEREMDQLANLIARRVDGLVCISAEMTAERIAPVIEEGIPVVTFERQIAGVALDAVGIDNVAAASAATRHLLSLGHRRIALIKGIPNSTISRERVVGFRKALTAAGVEVDESLIVQGNFRAASGRAAAARLMALRKPPTAIFALNDLMAMGALQCLHEQKIRVPEQVAVVGFDGIPLSAYVSPPLTTVIQPLAEMGRAAINLLLERIRGEGSDGARALKLEARLAIRGSTVAAAAQEGAFP